MKINPVLDRELRQRMRGARSAVLLTLYLLVLTGVFLIMYLGIESTAQSYGRTGLAPTDIARFGRASFEWLLFFMLLLLLFIVPGMTSGTISGERERQTLVPMQLTLLAPRSIIVGKVQASMSFLAFLLVAALPLVSICYVVGGISLADALGGLLSLLFNGVVLACVAVACSTLVKRTQAATLVAYTFTFLLVAGNFILYGIVGLIHPDSFRYGNNGPTFLLFTNPFMNVAALIGGSSRNTSAQLMSPFGGLREIIAPASHSYSGMGPATVTQSGSDEVLRYAAGSTAALSAVALIAIMFATRRIRTPAENER